MGGAVGAAGAAAILAAHVPPGRLDPEETGYVLAAVAAVVAAVAAAIVAYVLVPADRVGDRRRSAADGDLTADLSALTAKEIAPKFRITMRMNSR